MGSWPALHCLVPDTGVPPSTCDSAELHKRDVSPTGAGPEPTPGAWLGRENVFGPFSAAAPASRLGLVCLSAEDVRVSFGF